MAKITLSIRQVAASLDEVKTRLDTLEPAEGRPVPPDPPTPVDLRLELVNHKRVGEEMLAKGQDVVPHRSAQNWTDDVLETLREHATPAIAETFRTVGSGNIVERMPDRIQTLQNILWSIPRDRASTAGSD